jgi:hypothetical protein
MPWDTLTLIALPVALLALTVSGAIVVSGWKQRRDLQLRVSRVQAPDRLELGRTPLASGPIDVASEVEAVLGLFAGQAATSHVALEFAVQPQLTVRADPRAFREILFDLVDNAVAHASCGRVLLGAARSGPRVEIAVLDDSANSNQQDRRSELRSAERLAALYGAVLEVDVHTGDGTTITVSLPAANPANRALSEEEALDPASIWREVSSATR